MLKNRLFALLTLLALIGGLFAFNATAPDVLAQNDDGNLLNDPGFEDSNMKGIAVEAESGTTFSVNVQWEGWFTETPRNESWQNRIPNGTGRNNAGMGFVRTGNRSMELSRGGATFTAAVYQTVTVPENANLIGSAWVVMNISGDNAEQANSTARVGIDPTGGTNPLSSNVIWSNTVRNALASNGYQQMTVNATAQGTRATIFLWATQTVPTTGNGVFFDDASLRVGGPGGGTAPSATAVPGQPTATPLPPTPPAVVAFVNPQGERPDGSIRHVVQEGDTLSSIAVAYSVPMDTIRELNPDIGLGRFLFVGQELLIRRPETTGPSAPMPPVQEQPTQPEQPTQQEQPPAGLPAPQQPPTGEQQPPVVEQQPPVVQQPAPSPAVRISTLFYFTNDLEVVRNFYGTLIGLDETAFEEGDKVAFDLGGVEIVFLLTERELPMRTEWARQPAYPGGTVDEPSFIISVTDSEFEAIVGRIGNAGVTVFNDAILVPEVGQRAIFVRDPLGQTVSILNVQGE